MHVIPYAELRERTPADLANRALARKYRAIRTNRLIAEYKFDIKHKYLKTRNGGNTNDGIINCRRQYAHRNGRSIFRGHNGYRSTDSVRRVVQ